MSYEYKIVTLTEKNGKPAFPGARRIEDVGNGNFVVHGPFVNRRGTTLAVIYRDPSGKYLVGAEKPMLDALQGESLDSLVSKNPANWHTWKCDTPDEKGKLVTTDKIKAAVTSAKPVTLSAGVVVIGATPTAPVALGKFSPSDIEKTTKWIGDKNTKTIEVPVEQEKVKGK